jgi:hypothetical protein
VADAVVYMASLPLGCQRADHHRDGDQDAARWAGLNLGTRLTSGQSAAAGPSRPGSSRKRRTVVAFGR